MTMILGSLIVRTVSNKENLYHYMEKPAPKIKPSKIPIDSIIPLSLRPTFQEAMKKRTLITYTNSFTGERSETWVDDED